MGLPRLTLRRNFLVKYYFEGYTFVIEDYQHAKRFSSFLPAMAGKDGKPLWAFYANVGQCMGGFGINNKETPIGHWARKISRLNHFEHV